ncbi:serine protein kinase RIO [Cellulosimicrobium marinum]|uniref:serine protein kinase RIO n=1 Tax=Cellulosimicrobium marinum TaxID=1638992 RepID=UPI001E643D10|nr:RIO1 family regulatory kinase/ATPase [Cellulosimicrobium marinum]MCB7137320.1 serine/threonine protein kinase [Cellulosimicrobium marinum]
MPEHDLTDPYPDLPPTFARDPRTPPPRRLRRHDDADELAREALGVLDAALGPGQRWSTWHAVEKGQRGPEPRPDWVVTADAAVDTDLGVLKTGKEADVFLVERAVPGDPARRSVLAAKRYRDLDHRAFRRDTLYTEDRRVRRTRDRRALDRKSSYGRQVAAGQWAAAEFAALGDLWSAGAPVPYPLQIDGNEILMEFVGSSDGDAHEAAPRLARARPDAELLASWWDQLRDAMAVMARHGWAHGDLSPYNVLVDDDRIVIIDLPQVVDLVANPFGTELLLRDCRTMSAWFASRGLDADADTLFADLLAQAW